jgi:cytochrome c-type biogenesis protein CcmH/NrfG
VGVVLAIGYTVDVAVKRVPGLGRALLASAAACMLAGIVVSSDRGRVWRDNETLLRQTVVDVPSSYRAHLMLGELLTNTGNYEEGLVELAKAVSLSGPQDVFVRRFAGSRFHAAGFVNAAQRYFEEAAALEGMSESGLLQVVNNSDSTSLNEPDSVITD